MTLETSSGGCLRAALWVLLRHGWWRQRAAWPGCASHLDVTLEQVLNGGDHTVTFKRKKACTPCGGSGARRALGRCLVMRAAGRAR